MGVLRTPFNRGLAELQIKGPADPVFLGMSDFRRWERYGAKSSMRLFDALVELGNGSPNH